MKHKCGRVELICGSMFSGKTEELIRRLRRAQIAKQKVQVFKPVIDKRYGENGIWSHGGVDFEATPVADSNSILSHLDDDTRVVGIDEVQFFDSGIIEVVRHMASFGIRVILAGLDTDFRGEPFGPMPQLLCEAEHVDKLHAVCMVCGEEACRTQRLIDGQPAYYDDKIILVGGVETYEPRCRDHHVVAVRSH